MSLTKEVHRLMKNVRKLTEGQVSVVSYESDRIECPQLTIVIEPNAGLYKGGRYKFTISIPDDYPHDGMPSVWCDTKIYHPNIDVTEEQNDDFDTNVCLNILELGIWKGTFGLQGVVLGLLFLIHNPNFDDPLSPEFSPGDDERYIANIRNYMNGEDVDGIPHELEPAGEGGEKKDDGEKKTTDAIGTTEEAAEVQDSNVCDTKEDDKIGPNNTASAEDTITHAKEQTNVICDTHDEDSVAYDFAVLSVEGECVFICEGVKTTVEQTDKVEEIRQDTSEPDDTRNGTVKGTEDDDVGVIEDHTQTFNASAAVKEASPHSMTETITSESNVSEVELERTTQDNLGEKIKVTGGNGNHDRQPYHSFLINIMEEIESDKICRLEENTEVENRLQDDNKEMESRTQEGKKDGDICTQLDDTGEMVVTGEKKDGFIVGRKCERMNSYNDETTGKTLIFQNCCDYSRSGLNLKEFQSETSVLKRIARKLFVNFQYIGRNFLKLLND